MRLPLLVTFAEGQQSAVTAGPADFIAFERRFDTSATTLEFKTKPATDTDGTFLEEDGQPIFVLDVEDWTRRVKVEWFYFLAWSALRRPGVELPEDVEVPDDFDEFLETIFDVSIGNLASGVDPTGPTPDRSPGESPASPSEPASTPTKSSTTSKPSKQSSPTATTSGRSASTSSP